MLGNTFIEQGAVTAEYSADRETVVNLLNETLATEIVCVLRYKRHFFTASSINAEGVAAEFLQHANEEQTHADQLAQRIVQLGGESNFFPEGLLGRSHLIWLAFYKDSAVSLISYQ